MNTIVRWSIVVLVGLTVGLAVGVALSPEATDTAAVTLGSDRNAASSRGPAPVSLMAGSRPARTGPEEKYPSRKLMDSCRREAEALGRKLDRSFATIISPPFVIVGNMPRRTVRAYADHTIVAAAEAMWADYFRKKPDKVIRILLFKDEKSYRYWAKKLLGDEKVSYFGYYRSWDRTMVMNIGTGGGTLVHELTHALIVYDFPDVPTWFNEGLGSLHEQCRIRPKGIIGYVNWRLPALKTAIRRGTLRPLRELVTRRDFRGKLMGLNYAQARYFVMYMQKRGLLGKFYEYFREHHTGRGADVKAIEHVFGKGIDTIEKKFLAWLGTLQYRR